MPGITPQAELLFKALQEQWGSPLNVTSAYRTPEHNAAVGGARHSQHLTGNAFDVDVSRLSEAERQALIRKARGVGFGGVGVYDTSLHFDAGPQRAWGPNYHKESLPGWALPALQAGAPIEGDDSMAGWMPIQSAATTAAALAGPQPLRRGQPGPQMVNFTGPGQMEIAALLQQAAAADDRAVSGVNNGTIPGGIASVVERISGAVNRGRALSAEEKRRQAIVEALGGAPGGQEGPPDPRLAALDPELYAQRVAAYEASQADAAKQAFTARENELNRAARIQAAREGRTSINNTVTGDTRPQVGTIPQGWELRQTDTGWQMAPIAGGPADVAAQEAEAAKVAASEQTARTGGIVLEDIGRLIDRVKDAPWYNPAVGLFAETLSQYGGTNAADVKELATTVTANIGFDRLQAMREASKNGGALGAISEREMSQLAATSGSLAQSQSKEQFLQNAERLERLYQDIIRKAQAYPNAAEFGFAPDPAVPGASMDQTQTGEPKKVWIWNPETGELE